MKYLEILLLILAAAVVRFFTLRLLRRSEWKHKNFLLALFERLITPILALGVIAACINLFPLADKFLAVMNYGFYIAILVIGIYCAAKADMTLLNRWLEARQDRERLREPVQFVIRAVFATFGAMIALENLGVSLTAVWTTLGVGSVAIALALQDTLSKFSAGVYLRIDHPVSLGDYLNDAPPSGTDLGPRFAPRGRPSDLSPANKKRMNFSLREKSIDILHRDPNNRDAHYLLGELFYQQKDWEQARIQLEVALRYLPWRIRRRISPWPIRTQSRPDRRGRTHAPESRAHLSRQHLVSAGRNRQLIHPALQNGNFAWATYSSAGIPQLAFTRVLDGS